MAKNKYIILSPDGITIHPTDTYKSNEVLDAFRSWKERYRSQGYYSSNRFGRIPLEELEDYCEVRRL
jgi:hypothetical protein